MQTRSALWVGTLLVFAGCQDDLTEEKARWDASTKGWSVKFEQLKKDQAALAEKARGITLPIEEPGLAADLESAQSTVKNALTAITEGEHTLEDQKTAMAAVIGRGKKVPVEVALSSAQKAVDGVVAQATSLVSAGGEAIDLLSRKAATVKAELEASKSRTEAWSGELKKKGGLLAIDDLLFKGESVDADHSRVPLTSLIATLKACPELRVETTVTAVGEAADLGTKRADSLKTWLTTHGVDGAVISKLSGTQVGEGDEKVLVAVTTPCK